MSLTSNISLANTTRDEIYALAKERDIVGRSNMTKAELREALEAFESEKTENTASRVENFRELARAFAQGKFVMLPRTLKGNDRRMHIRQTLREDHYTRIVRRSEDAEIKFDELAESTFAYFRGTALLFYRDMAGEDAWMPTVLASGDVHPQNFGVMPNANNVPIFGVNDFDEAHAAPFTWDLKRGATGFMLAAGEIGGYGRKRQRKIARRFVRGYLERIQRFKEHDAKIDYELRIDNAPRLIRGLIEHALQDRADWLADDYLDEFGRAFRSNEKLVPLSERRDDFQKLVNQLVEANGIHLPGRSQSMRVKDVALRRGQGTASLGLDRYYTLIEGVRADGSDDLIIEFKQARCSALSGLAPPLEHGHEGRAERIAHAQAAQLVRGDVFYGSVEFEGTSFMARERAPYRDDIDLDDLSKDEWQAYAKICGQTLAHTHALADETSDSDNTLERKIIRAIGSPALFADDIVRWAWEAAERTRGDHETFQADHSLGAFQRVEVAYR